MERPSIRRGRRNDDLVPEEDTTDDEYTVEHTAYYHLSPDEVVEKLLATCDVMEILNHGYGRPRDPDEDVLVYHDRYMRDESYIEINPTLMRNLYYQARYFEAVMNLYPAGNKGNATKATFAKAVWGSDSWKPWMVKLRAIADEALGEYEIKP